MSRILFALEPEILADSVVTLGLDVRCGCLASTYPSPTQTEMVTWLLVKWLPSSSCRVTLHKTQSMNARESATEIRNKHCRNVRFMVVSQEANSAVASKHCAAEKTPRIQKAPKVVRTGI